MPENPIRRVLEGKPLRQPLHTMLVHFPIGLFVISLVLDIASYFGNGSNALVRGALYTMCGGVAMGIVAAIPGFVDWTDIRRDNPARGIGQWHMSLNLVVLTAYGMNILARLHETDLSKTDVPLTVTSAVALCVLTASGYLGGIMVYDDGIGVGRHRRRGLTPVRTIPLTRAGAPDGWVPVPGAELMANDQTLRLNIDGLVIALAKAGGTYYAFQEFCTHRHGPLSEGCLHDGKITCPWHRSQFDLHTGRVVHGPAKKDIHVYEARVIDGTVSIRIPPHGEAPAARPRPAAGAIEEKSWKAHEEQAAIPDEAAQRQSPG